MASPKLSITRKTPQASFDLDVTKQMKFPDELDIQKLSTRTTNGPPGVPLSANTSVAVPPSTACSIAPRPLPQEASNCPSPNERKLLVETAADIARSLLEQFRAPRSKSHGVLPAEPAGPPTDSCGANPCVHCGGNRPCGPGCCCPCHGVFASRTCAETMKKEIDKNRGEFEPLPEPPDPETIIECKPQQLRAGKFLMTCDCTKRNGLQHLCRRWGCSEKCPRVRPKQRVIPVSVLDSTPRCCAGKMQAEMYRMMEAKVDEMIKKTQTPRHCEEPYVPPKLPPPPPPFNWNGIFPHVCRQPGYACKGLPKPFPKIPCNAGCKHWTVPRPCSYPICRADCYEDPPPKPPPSDLAALTLTVTPYLKQETC